MCDCYLTLKYIYTEKCYSLNGEDVLVGNFKLMALPMKYLNVFSRSGHAFFKNRSANEKYLVPTHKILYEQHSYLLRRKENEYRSIKQFSIWPLELCSRT